MSFALKPILEADASGRAVATIHIDGTDGNALGIASAGAHATEAEARSALCTALREHLSLTGAGIEVDGVSFGRDVERAVAAIVVHAAVSGTMRKASPIEAQDEVGPLKKLS